MPDWVFMLVGQIFVAGAIYGAMKADLKALHEKVAASSAVAARAHERIDSMLMKGGDHG